MSVIVCTRDRPQWLARAVRSVLAQEADDLEVLIVDDASVSPPELPADPRGRIRLLRLDSHRGPGAARAAGLRAAEGELIAYCDDDDEWHPGHLRILVEYLRQHPEVDLVYGDSEWRQVGVAPTVAYSFDYDLPALTGENYIFASDVLHRAAAARVAGGFDETLPAYEDWDLWLRMSQSGTFRHVPAVVGTHHWHEDAVSAGDCWQVRDQVYELHQQRLAVWGLHHELEFATRNVRTAPFDPATWRPGRRELIWYTELQPDLSFGQSAGQLLQALERRGIDVIIPPTLNQQRWGFDRFYKPLSDWSRIGFYYRLEYLPGALPCERLVTYTMWESTVVPEHHVREINRAARLLLVPSRQNLDAYRDSGVGVPIKVLHLGIDRERFPVLERPRRDLFTFGTFGELTLRKGIDVLLRAFRDEFRRDEPVRLRMKNLPRGESFRFGDDERIEVVSGFLDPPALLALLASMDVFVLPSRGEGFGLTGLEAMATGLPLIATAWGGPVEYLDAADSFPLDYRLVDAGGAEAHGTRFHGQWAEPDYEHLRSLLRWAYEHPAACAEMGKEAARRVAREWTWERIAAEFEGYLDEIASG